MIISIHANSCYFGRKLWGPFKPDMRRDFLGEQDDCKIILKLLEISDITFLFILTKAQTVALKEVIQFMPYCEHESPWLTNPTYWVDQPRRLKLFVFKGKGEHFED